MDKTLVISDTHSSMEMLERIFEIEAASGSIDAVLHPGDIGIYDERSLARISDRERYLIEKHDDPIHNFFPYIRGDKSFAFPVHAIPGNHEDFDLVDGLQRGDFSIANLNMLGSESMELISSNGATIKVMGLGKILPAQLRETRRSDRKYIQDVEIESFRSKALAFRPDVLMFHEAPFLSRMTPKGGLSHFGSPAIMDLITAISPRLVLCGHMHFEYRITIGETVIIGLGYGAKGRYGVLHEDLGFEWKGVYESPYPPVTVVLPGEAERPVARARKIANTSRIALPISGAEMVARFGLEDLDHEGRKNLGFFFRDLKERIDAGETITAEKAWRLAEKFMHDGKLR